MSEESNASQIESTSDRLSIYYGDTSPVMEKDVNEYKSGLIYHRISEIAIELEFYFVRADTDIAKQSEAYNFKIDIRREYL